MASSLAAATAQVLGDISTFLTAHPSLTTILAILTTTYLFLISLLYLTQSPAEPPALLTTIPFLSPIISMTQHSMSFYTYMHARYPNLPVYTLRLPSKRIYIINSTHLISLIQRQWKKLIFAPVTVQAMEGAFGVDKAVVDLAREGVNSERGFIQGLRGAIHPVVGAGSEGLKELNERAAGGLSASLGEIEQMGEVKKVRLYEWIRRELTMATTDAVYGRGVGKNPLREAKNEAAWCTFLPSIMFMVLNIFPAAFFKTAIRARESLAASFVEYYLRNKDQWTQEQHSDDLSSKDDGAPSEYIKAWTRRLINFEKTSHIPFGKTIGNLYLGGLFPLVANTVPACYWMVYRVFSDVEIARACREEILQAVRTEGDNVRVLNADYLKRKCPLLVSTFQEVFRVHGMANSVRIATEDYVLEVDERTRYLIKRGGMVMMPARVQHYMREVWGDDVDVFDHRRFLRAKLRDSSGKRFNPVAFRGFGGGTTLCPGRHFATTEILVFTAMLLLRFEIVPTGAGGKWVLPTTGNSSQAEAIEQPDWDFEVELRSRAEMVGLEWRVASDQGVQAQLVAEDL